MNGATAKAGEAKPPWGPRGEGDPSSTVAAKRSLALGHIPSLDGLRAVSFLLVFVAHAGYVLHSSLGALVPGGFGVTIFFFLSGLLITTLMRVEYERTGDVSFKQFYLRRTLRILPPFYIVLAGATLWSVFVARSAVSSAAVTAQALHVTNYWTIGYGTEAVPAGTAVYWSLAVEEHFYLIFPWIYLAMRRAGLRPFPQALFLWGLCGAVLVWRCILVFHFGASVERTNLATDTRMDSILFGCALAVWNNPVLDAPVRRSSLWKFVIFPVAIGVLAVCIGARGSAFRETWRYSIQGVALTAVFIAAVSFPSWSVFKLLNLKPVAFIGVLSYSLYLVHFAVLYAVEGLAPRGAPLAKASVALAASFLISYAIYSVVEKPCARLRKRLGEKGTSSRTSSPLVARPTDRCGVEGGS